MGGHEIMLVEMEHRALQPVRDRKLERQRQIDESKATEPISTVTWFGGLKATASFLRDAARATMTRRTMTEAHG